MRQNSERDEIVSRYLAGASCPEIAVEMRRSTSFVWSVVKAAGAGRCHAESMALRMAKHPNLSERRGLQCVFHSRKNGAWLPAGSTYEFMRMSQLEDDPAVASFERSRDRITYTTDRDHYYIPDLHVVMKDGSLQVEEIKPTFMLARWEVQQKLAAAKGYYAARGISFIVVTEAEIGLDYMKNFKWTGIALLTMEERSAMRKDRERVRHRLAKRAIYAGMSAEERQRYNAEQRKRYQNRKASMTADQLAAHRAKNAEAQRLRRARKSL